MSALSAEAQTIPGFDHTRSNRANSVVKLATSQKLPQCARSGRQLTANEEAVDAGKFSKVATMKLHVAVYTPLNQA